MDEPEAGVDWQKALALAGVGVVGGGALLGSLLWLVKQKDVLNIRVTHAPDPAFVAKYGPLLEHGVDVNFHLFSKGEKGDTVDKVVKQSVGRSPQTGSTGYDDTPSGRGDSMAHLLDAFGATAVAEAEALISEMDGPELPEDDGDLLRGVLGADGDEDLLDDGLDDDDLLPPGMPRVPGMTTWNVQNTGIREVGVAGVSGMGFGEDQVGRISFQSPIEITTDRAVSPHPLPRQHELEVIRVIPYMSTNHLLMIVRNSRRSKRVHAVARAELMRRERGGRSYPILRETFPAVHAGWRPSPHWQGYVWPAWHPHARMQAVRPPARPPARPPVRPPIHHAGPGPQRWTGPGGPPFRPQPRPGVVHAGPGPHRGPPAARPWMGPGLVRAPSGKTPLQLRTRLGAVGDPPSLVSAWGAHPYQTAAAGMAALLLGAAAAIGIERAWTA